jgi:hypothetical protein
MDHPPINREASTVLGTSPHQQPQLNQTVKALQLVTSLPLKWHRAGSLLC